MVKYIYKDKTPVAEVWPTKKKIDTGTMVIIGGITVFALIATGYAWWQMNHPQAKLSCHTCGGVLNDR